LALAGTLAVGFLAVAVLSAQADETRSAFSQGEGTGPATLVAQATGLGLSSRRLASGPLGLQADPGLDPASTLLVVVAPDRPYSEEEREEVAAFLESGGRLLVADNFGQAGTLATRFGIAFERVLLVEENATAPVHRLDSRSLPIDLRRPTALRLAAGLDATASTSAASFLDRDGDGIIEAGDPHGPFPVVAEATVGEGTVLAVADPLLLAPDGRDTPRNAAWREAVLQHLLPSGGTVLVDESRAGTDDPVVAGLGLSVAAAGSTLGATILGTLALLLLAATAAPRVRSLWGPHRFRPDRFVRRGAVASQAPGPAAPPTRVDGWTERGMVALLACPALAFAALATASREAAWAAGLLGVLAAASLLLGAPRARATREVAQVRVAEETAVPVGLVLEAGSRTVEVEAMDALPPEFNVVEGTNWRTLRLHGTSRWSYTVKPALRGPYDVGPLVLRRRDPLGLHVREQVAAPATRLEVLPRRHPLNRVPFGTRLPSITLGPHFVNRAGEGSEFHSLREYQEGDSFRAINWRASARATQMVVNQRVHESMATVTLFLDARAVSGAGPASTSPLADGCRAALSLAAGALQVRDRVRVLVYGDGVRELSPGGGPRQVHELTDLLASLAPAGATSFEEALAGVLPQLRAGNPVILFSGLEADPSIPKAMQVLRSRGLLPLVVASPLGTRPMHADEGGPEPDAAAIETDRQATLRALRSAGIPTLETRRGVPLDHLFRLGGLT
ncbi:MAG TPA: DUF4350 domain-containing protein, partial [Candidatus Thermoplasmatota archaeon]|nr:DUF4350 domain-containing protein [Candidatus Thermoplasmatota archaeon]